MFGKKPGITPEAVLDALRQVQDPELYRDIVSLGMIKDIEIKDGNVAFRFVLTTPACPVRGELKDAACKAVESIPGVKSVDIKMDASVASASRPDNTIPGVRNVIAVGSGKGGVGKTTVSVNLACALALEGAKVGLIDADITGPNVPLMMGVASNSRPLSNGKKMIPLQAYGIKLISLGFFMPDNTAVVWRGPMVSGAIKQFMQDVEWEDLDYLIIDLPPGTGDAALTVAQNAPLSGMVLVTTPQNVALLDGQRAVAMFQQVDVPILGLIENMSYFICPHCGERTDIFSTGGGEHASHELEVPFLGQIPLDVSIREGGDSGKPVTMMDPEGPHARAFRAVARQIAGRISTLALAEPATAGVE